MCQDAIWMDVSHFALSVPVQMHATSCVCIHGLLNRITVTIVAVGM